MYIINIFRVYNYGVCSPTISLRKLSVSKSDDAYQQLCRDIEFGDLAPGDLFTEADLSERLRIGRTPLREALQRLTREHIISVRGRAGIQIPPLSVDDQLGRLEVRRALECLTVALSTERASVSDLRALKDIEGALKPANEANEYLELLRKTQELILSYTGNAYLQEAMKPLLLLSRRFWRAHLDLFDESVTLGKQHHLEIIKAILRRDSTHAQQAALGLNDYLIDFTLDVAKKQASIVRNGEWLFSRHADRPTIA